MTPLEAAAKAVHESASQQDVNGYLDARIDAAVLAQAAITAYLSALPDVSGLVERLRNDAAIEDAAGVMQDYYHAEILSEAADALTAQAARNAELEADNATLRKEVERLRKALGDSVEALTPFYEAWNIAFNTLGGKPSTLSDVEALAKHYVRGGAIRRAQSSVAAARTTLSETPQKEKP